MTKTMYDDFLYALIEEDDDANTENDAYIEDNLLDKRVY